MLSFRRILPVALAIALPTLAYAQDPTAPSVVTVGTGRVVLAPTKARLVVRASSRAATAAAASAQNDRRVEQLLAALRGARGVDSVRLTYVGVAPTEDDDGRVVDFSADASVELLVRDLAALNGVLDAAVRGGATRLGQMRFEVDSTAGARQEALRRAVADARREAEALAAAAGQPLGPLVHLATGPDYASGFNALEEASITTGFRGAEFGNARSGVLRLGPTPRDVVVSASVTARWRLGQ